MNNIELEQEILEILTEDNYFEMILKVKDFEPIYKKSDFYKATKKPLSEVIKECKIYYALQLRDASRYIQALIDGISLDNISQILDKAENMFSQENKEVKESLEEFKDLKN